MNTTDETPFLFRYMPPGNYNVISEKIYNYIVNHTTILYTKSPRDDWAHWYDVDLKELNISCPELEEYFSSINLEMDYVSIIYSPAGMQGMIHIDSNNYKTEQLPLRCLWPIKNCEGSFTKFFSTDTKNVIDKTILSGHYYREPVGPTIEIGAIELTRPVIFNPNIAHGVFTNPECTEGRITISIKFNNTDSELLNL